MLFFLLIPLWLGVLAIAAGFAFIRGTRVLALYLAVSSTSALLFAMTVRMAATVALAEMSRFAKPAPNWTAWVWLAGYRSSIVVGGLLGALLGVLLARWLRVRNQRITYRLQDH